MKGIPTQYLLMLLSVDYSTVESYGFQAINSSGIKYLYDQRSSTSVSVALILF